MTPDEKARAICSEHIKAPWCTDDYHLQAAVAQAIREERAAPDTELIELVKLFYEYAGRICPSQVDRIGAAIAAATGKPFPPEPDAGEPMRCPKCGADDPHKPCT